MPRPRKLKAGIRGDVVLGRRVRVVEPANLYGCEIGDDSFVGPFTEIQAGVKIGKRCKIQSHAFLCELATIGNDCFISHGVMFINDRFSSGRPAGGRREKWEPTWIGDRVSIGSNATVLPVKICSGCVVGAGSVVTRDLPRRGIYAGNPARLLRALP